ncbi:hypothetical protein BH24BAC1_BH24BAC1_01750 [soil metagenome]
MTKIPSIFLLLFLMGGGCSQKIEEGAFDSPAWKGDSFACKGERQRLVPAFQDLRVRLFGHNPKEVIALFGRPDAEELRAGSERVFIYYVEPGPQCEPKRGASEANKVQVRFNALNQVSEVSYTQPIGDLLRQ